MSENDPLLKIRFEGNAVGPGKIPVSHLLTFLTNLTKAFQRTGRVLAGDSESAKRGRQPQSIKDDIALELMMLTHGSPAAVLGFERRQTQLNLPGMDMGLEIFERSLKGLIEIQTAESELPTGFDAGVLMAWRDAGLVFSQGVSCIEFSLNHRAEPVSVRFTPEGLHRIQERIQGPTTNIRVIEGRLLMADFKEHGTRCRVHPSFGEPVLCLFDDEQKDDVLEEMLQYVRITGKAKEDPGSGKIVSIKIIDIQRLPNKEDQAAELLPQGTPISYGFWESPTLDELAQTQNVQPMKDVRSIFGTWPGELDDGFETIIDDLRHPQLASRDTP
jgi:hypothetical protein